MNKEEYLLSDAESEKIFRELWAKKSRESHAKEHPKIFILGGQPGSGKSFLTEIIKRDIFKNESVTTINGDDYRVLHPKAREIYDNHGKEFADYTHKDASKWAHKLLDKAVENRRDIIFETTMRNKEPLMTTINNLAKEGYSIGISVIAVNEITSSLGIVERYEQQKSQVNRIARWTPKEVHDEAFRNFPETAQLIEQESPIDSVRIYNRRGEILYLNESVNGTFKRPAMGNGVKSAIIKERNKPLSREEINEIKIVIEKVKKTMEARGEESENIISDINIRLEKHVQRDEGFSISASSGESGASMEKLYKQISLFMSPEKYKEFLAKLEKEMKDPEHVEEILSIAMKDKARIKHFEDRLEAYRDKLTPQERQYGEAFLRTYSTHIEHLNRKDVSEKIEPEEQIERYSLAEEKEREKKERSGSERDGESQRGKILERDKLLEQREDEEREADEREKEPVGIEVKENSTSLLTSADVANAKVAATEFLNSQALTVKGLNSDDGKVQSAANASDELKSVNTVTYKDAVKSVRTKMPDKEVRPPKLNEDYGPGKLSIDKQLALLTLANNKVIAYEAKDFHGKFEEGKTYNIASIKRTEQGITVKTGIARDIEKERENKQVIEKKRENVIARKAEREAIRAIGGIIGNSKGRGMEM